jgi:hypothetical protein
LVASFCLLIDLWSSHSPGFGVPNPTEQSHCITHFGKMQ